MQKIFVKLQHDSSGERPITLKRVHGGGWFLCSGSQYSQPLLWRPEALFSTCTLRLCKVLPSDREIFTYTECFQNNSCKQLVWGDEGPQHLTIVRSIRVFSLGEKRKRKHGNPSCPGRREFEGYVGREQEGRGGEKEALLASFAHAVPEYKRRLRIHPRRK